MNEEEKNEIAAGIDEVGGKLGPVLNAIDVKPQSKVMALALMAAHELLHDGGNEEDFQMLASTCWKRSVEIHARCTHDKN
jgi:hypothetical protein